LAKRATKRADAAVSAAVLGDWLGVSRPAISDLTSRGVIERGKGGYDLRASVRRYAEHLRKALTGRGGEQGAATVARERARLAREQADHVALKNATLRGSMLDAGAVEREWGDVLRGLRAGMLAVPSRCGARLAHLTPHDIAEIDAEVRAVLTLCGRDEAAN
jgi:phage terminase Nu1 subunit (DNA packaging protein)